MTTIARQRMSLFVLCLILAFSLIVLWMARPVATALSGNQGHDFLLLYAAAHALRDHQNPYSPAILGRNAHLAGLPWDILLDNKHQLTQPYVYPPLFAWLVIPLTYLNPKVALLVWSALSAAAVFAGTYGLTALWNQPTGILGSRARRIIFAAIVTATPVTLYSLYWGNTVVLVYWAMGAWIWALTREQRWSDIAAGALMSVSLLKPQLALPLALLAAFCLLRGSEGRRRRRRVVIGFVGACACWLAFDLLATGPGLLLDWPRSVLYLSRFINAEPDMPSLLGLLQLGLQGLPSPLTTGLSIAVVLCTVLVVLLLIWLLRRATAPETLLALLTVVWCFGAPYGHANDEILLFPGALALLAALATLPAWWRHRQRSGSLLVFLSWMSRAVLGVVFAIIALCLLYLGGTLTFFTVGGHRLPFNVAGLVPLSLLVALSLTLPTYNHRDLAAVQADIELPVASRCQPREVSAAGTPE